MTWQKDGSGRTLMTSVLKRDGRGWGFEQGGPVVDRSDRRDRLWMVVGGVLIWVFVKK